MAGRRLRIHDLTREINTALAQGTLREDNRRELLDAIVFFDSVLGVFGESKSEMLGDEIQKLIDGAPGRAASS